MTNSPPQSKTPTESKAILSQLMGPEHANIHGNVHGGLLMKMCDEAGGMAAARHARHPVVTVVVDSMSFLSPVNIGNLVTCTAKVTWTGHTSIETKVIVTAEDVLTGAVVHTNSAYFVYVALDDNGRPVPISPLRCETEAEVECNKRAAQRRDVRLRNR